MGISEGNDGGDFSKGHKARGFSAGLLNEERAAECCGPSIAWMDGEETRDPW